MLGKETKVLQRTITMRDVIFEELEEDASQEDKNEKAEISRNQPKNI